MIDNDLLGSLIDRDIDHTDYRKALGEIKFKQFGRYYIYGENKNDHNLHKGICFEVNTDICGNFTIFRVCYEKFFFPDSGLNISERIL